MRVVQRQPVQPGVDGVRPADPPMAVNRCAADIFRAVEQLFAAIGADDVAEQPPQITDVLVLAEMLRPGVYLRSSNAASPQARNLWPILAAVPYSRRGNPAMSERKNNRLDLSH